MSRFDLLGAPPAQAPARFVRSLWCILRGRPQTPSILTANEMLQTILRRRSMRSFRQEEIDADEFAVILEAGRLAPSTVNLQSWSFVTFTAESWRATFDTAMPFRAPRAVMILGDVHRDRTVLDAFPDCPLTAYTVAVMNASLAAMAMNLAAEALGVSSVMLSETGRSGFLDAGFLCERLSLPGGVFPLMTLVLGYAKGPRPPMPPKLALAQVCWEGPYREADSGVMADWLEQMSAGYKASHPLGSFAGQLRVYLAKIDQAERDLQRKVFARSEDAGALPAGEQAEDADRRGEASGGE